MFPECFHAAYGIPSGPGEECPESLIALVMSLRRICQSVSDFGKSGLVWLVLGASVWCLLEWWAWFACDAFALTLGLGSFACGRGLLDLLEEVGDALREVVVEEGGVNAEDVLEG